MSHTNSTTHYNLPQFIGTDTPGWLTDVNSAMSAIDTAIYARQQESVSNSDAITANTADINGLKTRMTTAEGSVSSLDQTVSGQSAQITNLQTSVTTNTSDIASLATRVTNLDAADIAYDNTGSGLTASTAQGAIDEIAARETTYTELVQETAVTSDATIQMSGSANDYDAIVIVTEVGADDWDECHEMMVIKPLYSKKHDISWWATDSTSWYTHLKAELSGDTLNNITLSGFVLRGYQRARIIVYGVKF